MKRILKFLAGGELFRTLVQVCICLACSISAIAFAQDLNHITALDVESGPKGTAVDIETELPVGYRYTVYDSFDPIRVVIDFPGMDTSALEPIQTFAKPPVKEVRISSFDLESGKLGRVEILLEQAENYEVDLSGNTFQVTFAAAPSDRSMAANTGQPIESKTVSGQAAPTPAAQTDVAEQEAQPGNGEKGQVTAEEVSPGGPAESGTATGPVASRQTAEILERPIINPGLVILNADGLIDSHQYFKLGSPPRLVVDLYGVKPGFQERVFSISQGMRRMRIGTYPDKTRVVFDADSDQLPGYQVTRAPAQVKVAWGEKMSGDEAGNTPSAVMNEPEPSTPRVAAVHPVTVEALDFNSEKGQSIFTVHLSRPAEVIPSTQTGDIVRFGVKNAFLGQKLRRSIDTSAFPSAVKIITPYTVQNGDIQEVRFAVELKGPVSFTIEKSGSLVKFIVDDGPFAEARSKSGTKEVVLSAPVSPAETGVVAEPPPSAPKSELDEVLAESVAALQPAADSSSQETESVISLSQGPYRISEAQSEYTGEKISLVFDNADIRKILQLIAEVSDLNIIASDEVKGNITLRLHEVPWDQALDLIMDIQDLGMVRSGNVARIMPRDRIRAMEEAKLTAKRTKEKLEDLVTEVVSISYTDLGNIESPAKELLSDRGKITKDARNKQIIVTDIPSVIADVRNLVAILDTPERQVMIEARIVEADSSFSRDLGVNWGLTVRDEPNAANVSQELRLGLGGSFLLAPPAPGGAGGSGLASAMTFGLLGTDTTLLDLRISAIESSGHGKIISTPRVTTLNGEKAKISQGTQIPYTVVSDSGANTEFVEAALSLEVTPVINPDGSIILDIKATNSTPGTQFGGDAPSINSKEAQTKVLVRDGETTVLGGIFVEDEDFSETGVPWLSRIPILGHLFKSTSKSNGRSELLVFITPRILQ